MRNPDCQDCRASRLKTPAFDCSIPFCYAKSLHEVSFDRLLDERAYNRTAVRNLPRSQEPALSIGTLLAAMQAKKGRGPNPFGPEGSSFHTMMAISYQDVVQKVYRA